MLLNNSHAVLLDSHAVLLDSHAVLLNSHAVLLNSHVVLRDISHAADTDFTHPRTGRRSGQYR